MYIYMDQGHIFLQSYFISNVEVCDFASKQWLKLCQSLHNVSITLITLLTHQSFIFPYILKHISWYMYITLHQAVKAFTILHISLKGPTQKVCNNLQVISYKTSLFLDNPGCSTKLLVSSEVKKDFFLMHILYRSDDMSQCNCFK